VVRIHDPETRSASCIGPIAEAADAQRYGNRLAAEMNDGDDPPVHVTVEPLYAPTPQSDPDGS
jgi:hypothetical protein